VLLLLLPGMCMGSDNNLPANHHSRKLPCMISGFLMLQNPPCTQLSMMVMMMMENSNLGRCWTPKRSSSN